MLSVTVDSNGWTNVTPSSDSRLIYVSSSVGSDGNNGLSSSLPIATLTKAYSLLRNGYPDWILLNRGDTFSGNFSYFSNSGRSSQEPMVITDYGDPTMPRPVIDSGASIAFRMATSNHDIYIMSVAFTTSTHNPGSPNYTGQGNYGFYDLGGTTDLLIEDCNFSYFTNDITLQGYYGPLTNVTIHRDEILDSYATAGHSEGLYCESTTNLTITSCVFDHDGWNVAAGAWASIYNHDCYLHSSNVNCVVENNIFANAASFGLEARSGGIVDNNLFINDPYGWAFGLVNGSTTTAGGVTGEAIGNIVLGARQDASGWGVGAWIGNLSPNGNTKISNNIFTNAPASTQPAIILQPGNGVSNPQQATGINNLVLSNNIVDNYGFGLAISNQFVPGSTGQFGLTNIVIKNNDFQNNSLGRIISHGNLFDPRYETWSGNTYSSSTWPQSQWFSLQGATYSWASWIANIEPTAVAATVPFVNPSVSISSYMASLGLTPSLDSFMAGADAQSQTNWNSTYFAYNVNNYLAAGFAVDYSPPTVTDGPPADVTAANYQTTPNPTFTVTYADAVGLNVSTITGNVITVTGAGGVVLPVTLLNTTASNNNGTVIATYQISAPGGDWTTVPYGTYVVGLVGGHVANIGGITAPAQNLASFQVTVNADPNPPTAAATTPTNFSATANSSNIQLSWSDPAVDQRSFVLTRATDSGFTQNVVTIPLTSDASSYTDRTAVVGQAYFYEISAVNELGASAPAAVPTSTIILPPAPMYLGMILDDGNTARTAIYSATLTYSQPVTITSSDVSLVTNSTQTPIAVNATNPSGDGKTWVLNWTTNQPNNSLPTGSYTLTIHNGLITDAYGQPSGTDVTKAITSAVPPTVTNAVYNHQSNPHSVSITFSSDVSASLSTSDLTVTNSSGQSQALAGVTWNAATLTATWTFAGILASGTYTATLNAAGVSDAFGVELDGNGNGIPGGNYSLVFSDVKPTLASISGAGNVNVNAPYSLTLGAITDPGQSNPTYLVNWGDGTSTPATNPGTLTHTYTSALGAITIQVDVIDGNGDQPNCASQKVSVNQPTASLSGGSNANPGAVYSLNLGAVSDPGNTINTYIVHWGDGTQNTYTPAAVAAAGSIETHVFTNAGNTPVADSISVDLVDNSGSGGTIFTNFAVAIMPITINPLPTVVISGSPNANIGGTYTLNIGAINDPGFTVSQLSINWGDGTSATTVTPSTTQVMHMYATGAPSLATVTASLADGSGVYSAVGSSTVTVNPTPTVVLSGNTTVNAGVAYALTVSPAVDLGQIVTAYTIHWGDGTTSVSATAGVLYHTYTAATTAANITVDLTDGEGTYTSVGTLPPVQVVLVPTISVSGNSSANVTGIYSLSLGPVSDPYGTAKDYVVNWGDASSTTVSSVTSAVVLTHKYAATGPNTITIDVVDSTKTWVDVASVLLSVAPTPTIALSGNSNANATGVYTLNLGALSDPGYTPSSVIVSWGDGQTSAATPNSAPTHVFAATGNYNISVQLTDSTGTYVAATQAVTVNPPPTISLSGSPQVQPGQSYALALGTVNDPGYTISQYIVNWGDGSSATYTSAGVVAHSYVSAAAPTITVQLTDSTGTYTAGSLATVVGVQPNVVLYGNPYAYLNGTYTLSLVNATDTNGAVNSYIINWGDSTSTTVNSLGPVSHTYSTAGQQNISVTVNDSVSTWPNTATLPVSVLSDKTLTVNGNPYANVSGFYGLRLGIADDPGFKVTSVNIDWGDGTTGTGLPNTVVNHVYTATGTYNIALTLSDSSGSYAAGGQAVIVNPDPTLALTGNPLVYTGTAYTLNFGTLNDPGYTATRYLVNWGDGTNAAYGAGAASATHIYHSPITTNVTVDVTDPTGTYAAAGSLPVNVVTVPTLTLSGAVQANVTGLYTLTLASVQDVNGTPTKYVVNWGDGSSSTTASLTSVTHVYTATGPATISVDVVDPATTFTAVATRKLTVNPTPTINLAGNGTAITGATFGLGLSTITDPGYTISQFVIHWGDGTSTTSTHAAVIQHTYTSNQIANISVDITDATGTYTNAGSLVVGVYPPNILPNSLDLGVPAVKGTSSYLQGNYTVVGGGTGIAGTTDQFHFSEAGSTGNKTLITELGSIQGGSAGAQAGIMMRASTAANAPFADLVVTAGGTVEFQYRTKAKARLSQTSVTGHLAPIWLKLVRAGNSFSAWRSSNGTTWTQVGTAHSITMPKTINTGLVSSGVSSTVAATAVFGNVTLT